MLYRAAKAAPSLQTPLLNTLRDLATQALKAANKPHSQSTPTNPRKRNRLPLSPLNSRKQLIQVISETETPEQLRDEEISYSSQLQDITDTESREHHPGKVSDSDIPCLKGWEEKMEEGKMEVNLNGGRS